MLGLLRSRLSLSFLSGIILFLSSFNRLSNEGIDAVLAVLLNEVCKVLHGAGTRVLNWGILGAGREELNGGESSDGVRNVVSGGVNLGDGDLGLEFFVAGVQLGQLLVLRSKTIEILLAG
jgi:hypothetical protein